MKLIPLSPLEQANLYSRGRRGSFRKFLTNGMTWKSQTYMSPHEQTCLWKIQSTIFYTTCGMTYTQSSINPFVCFYVKSKESKIDTQKNF